MMKNVQVGVIGVGSLGQHHARVYSELEGVELAGVCDRRPERAREVAEKLGCPAFGSAEELLETVEAVSLAVPTEAHAELGIEVVRRGAHLLVEKPIAGDLASADRLIQEADMAGRLLYVGHIERFNPVLQAVRPYVRKPRFFEAHRLGVFVARSLDVDVVLDLMIHDLDLVLWLTGQPVAEIRSVGIPVLTPRIDIANARIEFQDGSVANVTASRVSRERVRKFRFFQAQEYVSLDFHSRSLEMFGLAEENGARAIVERRPEVRDVEPLREELAAFVSAIRGENSDTLCTGQEGRTALATALDVLTASRRGPL